MAINIDTLKSLAQTIHDATATGENTAERVGNAFLECANDIAQANTAEEVTQALNTLQTSITANANAISSANSNISSLQNSVNTANNNISSLQNTISSLQTTITTLQNSLNTANNNISSLQTEVNNLPNVYAQSPYFDGDVIDDNISYQADVDTTDEYEGIYWLDKAQSFGALFKGTYYGKWNAVGDYGSASTYKNTNTDIAKAGMYRTSDDIWFVIQGTVDIKPEIINAERLLRSIRKTARYSRFGYDSTGTHELYLAHPEDFKYDSNYGDYEHPVNP